MKDQETINKQILIAEKELAALDAKRTTLQDRIQHLNLKLLNRENLKNPKAFYSK